MQTDQQVLRTLFKATVQEQRANVNGSGSLKERVQFSLMVQEKEHHAKKEYWLALHCFQLIRLIVATHGLKSVWEQLEKVNAHGSNSEQTTPAGNTGVTDTARSALEDYIAGVKS